MIGGQVGVMEYLGKSGPAHHMIQNFLGTSFMAGRADVTDKV